MVKFTIRSAWQQMRPCLLAGVGLLALALALALPQPVMAEEKAAFTAGQKSALEGLIRDYILENPEIIIQSLEKMEADERSSAERLQASKLNALADAIERDASDPVIGNAAGDVTLVEFFDYQCGYCKRMAGPMKALIEGDGNLRVVLKEYPILGPVSIIASRAALASEKQGKYAEFHAALMGFPGRLTEPGIMQVAREIGLNVAQLQKDMEAPEILTRLAKTRGLGEALAIRGTPAFIIAGRIIPGAVDLAELRTLVAEARAGAKQ